MKKIIVNNIKIFKVIACVLWGLISIPIIDRFSGFLTQLFLFFISIGSMSIIYLLIDNKLNQKINKKLVYSLNNCDFSPYIKEIEKELKIINKNKSPKRYYNLKFLLMFANIYQYGLSDNIIKEYKKFPSNKLDKYDYERYNQELILILAKEQKISLNSPKVLLFILN